MSEEEPTGLGGGVESAPEQTQPSVNFADEAVYNEFRSSLPEELRDSSVIQQTKSFESLAGQLLNAQKALGGKRIAAPSEDWGDQEWSELHSQFVPDEGEYSVPELAEDSEFTELADDDIQNLADLAGELGLSQHQFGALYNKLVEQSHAEQAEDKELLETAITEQLKEVRMDWGEAYEANLSSANQAFEAIAEEIPELREIVQSDPLVANNPGVLKLFLKIAEAAGDELPSVANTDPTSAFGHKGSHNINAEIENITTENKDLIMSNPSMLSPADRAKRDQILARRANLYTQLYNS